MSLVCAIILAACAGADGLQLSETSRVIAAPIEPRVAVLLVGIPRGWTNDFVNDLLNGVVNRHHADVFVNMCDSPDGYDGSLDMKGLIQSIGSSVKRFRDESQQELYSVGAVGTLTQFRHLRLAFDLMEQYENENGFTYDVVIKMRTEATPAASEGASIDLTGWEKEGRLHMMTDMVFWGQRKEMAIMADFFAATHAFYTVRYPDPLQRPLDVKALYESYLRDPRNSPNLTGNPGAWQLYNKLEALPYPDMGKNGAIENLRAALDDGIAECPSDNCSLRCGERYDVLCENKHKYCGKFGCMDHPDYHPGLAIAEKDILTWPISHGIILCDVGKSFSFVRSERGGVQPRYKARDCVE